MYSVLPIWSAYTRLIALDLLLEFLFFAPDPFQLGFSIRCRVLEPALLMACFPRQVRGHRRLTEMCLCIACFRFGVLTLVSELDLLLEFLFFAPDPFQLGFSIRCRVLEPALLLGL
jgi:hypothetical protein